MSQLKADQVWTLCSALIQQEFNTTQLVEHPLDTRRFMVNDEFELEHVTDIFSSEEAARTHKAAVDVLRQQLSFQGKPGRLVQPILRILKCMPKAPGTNVPHMTLLYQRPLWFKCMTLSTFIGQGVTTMQTVKSQTHASWRLWRTQFGLLMNRWLDSMAFAIITLGLSFGAAQCSPSQWILVPLGSSAASMGMANMPFELGLIDPLNEFQLKQTDMNDLCKMGFWLFGALDVILDDIDTDMRIFLEILRGPMDPTKGFATEKSKKLPKEDNVFLIQRLVNTNFLLQLTSPIASAVAPKPAPSSSGVSVSSSSSSSTSSKPVPNPSLRRPDDMYL
jgi:hypothetical protein